MNHDTPEPQSGTGDASVEARIVAWVLGEASAFEAAELERLCAETPDLLAFQRRMLALHGLLTESEPAGADAAWKLPPEKRQRLDGIFADEQPALADFPVERRIRRSGLRAAMAIAACLVLTLVLWQLMAPVWVTQTVPETSKTMVDYLPAPSGGGAGAEYRPTPAAPAAPPVPADAAPKGYVMSKAKNQSAVMDELQVTRQRRMAGEPESAPRVTAMEDDTKPELADASGLNEMPALSGSGLAGGRGVGAEVFKDAPLEPAASAERDLLAGGEPLPAAKGNSVADGSLDGFFDHSRLTAPAAMPSQASNAPRESDSPSDADFEMAGSGKLAQEKPMRSNAAMTRESKSDDSRAERLAEVDQAWKLDQAVEQAATGRKSEAPVNNALAKAAVLSGELSASGDPYSTFSLHISDASFQLAKAALAKGERPDPRRIKPEQFYNAVDYGDPGPAAGEAVAATIEQSAHPVMPGRSLVRVALRTASVGRAASQPLRLTLLVDQSGSMVRDDRRAAMEHALRQLGGLLTEHDVVSVVGFSRTPRLLADRLPGGEGGKLGDIIQQAASEGGTNLEEALKLGATIAERQQLAGAQNRIVLFTDGAANLGNADPDRLADQVTAMRRKGIAFDIAGIGADGLNDRLLGNLARNGDGRYYVVGEDDRFARQLAGAFRPAAENVKVQVIFNPLRVGNYKLLGFEKDRLRTEDFRNDAVDAAELAADEAGVALYQVETLAEGRGEIGELSVRFRDTAGGGMVERSWTIPYEASAPAFDRASPSMQLAGLSLLAAEKLRGGPAADAIDFKQLAKPLAEVRRFYQASPELGGMLQVIDAIK